MEIREAIKLLKMILRTVCLGNQKFIDAVKMAISALEKQEVDKCCETCKHKNRPVEESPCCDCYLGTINQDILETHQAFKPMYTTDLRLIAVDPQPIML